MYYVYVIKSKKDGRTYLGCTNDLRRRLGEHNRSREGFTKNKGPFEVRYYEAFFSKKDAFDREKRLKHHARGMIELKKRLINSLL